MTNWNITDDDKIFVLPTDTVFGLHARAFDKTSVEQISKLKQRDNAKSYIVLVASLKDLELFGVQVSKRLRNFLNIIWPGPYSVVLPVGDGFEYISDTPKIAFRIPDKNELLNLLEQTGPLVSTSANISGSPHMDNIKEIQNVFGDKVDKYIDGDVSSGAPSLVLDILR